jgi:hypothetical protein
MHPPPTNNKPTRLMIIIVMMTMIIFWFTFMIFIYSRIMKRIRLTLGVSSQ